MLKNGVKGVKVDIVTISEICTARVKLYAASDGQIIQHFLKEGR